MNLLKKYLYIILVIQLFLSYTPAVYAQTTSGFNYQNAGVSEQISKYLCTPNTVPADQTNYIPSNTTYSNNNSGILYQCVNQIYKFAIILAAVIAVFFIVIAGYVYMSANGDQEAVSKAKNIMTTSIASIVILSVGYVFLKAINPDLIEFHSVQPPSVMVATSSPESYTDSNGTIPPAGQVTTPLPNSSKASIADLQAAGCSITAESRPRNELPNIKTAMWDKLVQICKTVSATGLKPNVSSTVRREATGSYHQTGCAIDFADGGGNGFFEFNTKKGRPVGVAIYNAALAAGISEARINPGVDRNQTYHIHIDLGTSCPN